MPKNSFKTRLEIAKNKAYQEGKFHIKIIQSPSSILGTAFQNEHRTWSSAVVVGTIIGFILDN